MPPLDETNAAVDSLDEQLTAYLDGESSPEDARALEQRLARDGSARARLRELAGAWDLLDQLPRASVDESFAKTTVAMVAVAAKRDLEKLRHSEPRRRQVRWLWGIFGGLTAAAIGFAIVNYAWPDPNRRLLNDLALIENWRMYQEVGEIDFLRQLDRAGLFWTDGAEQSEAALPTIPTALDERRTYVGQLSENQLADLRRREETLEQLPEQEIIELRKLDTQLQTADDAARLKQILWNYHTWLNARSPLEIVDLRQASPQERVERIRALQSKDESEWVKKYGFPSYMAEDFRRVYDWLTEVAEFHAAEIEAGASTSKRELLKKSSPENRKRILLGLWFDQEFNKRRTEELAAMPAEDRRAFESMSSSRQRFAMMQNMRKTPFGERKQPLPLTDVEIRDLEKRLSPNAQKILADLAAKPKATPEEQAKAAAEQRLKIFEWVGASMRFVFFSRGFIGDKELRDYFDALPEDAKKELALLSPEELRREVRGRYIYDHIGGVGFGRGPGGPDGKEGHWNGESRGDGPRGDGPRGGGPPRPGDGPDGRPPRERGGFEGRGEFGPGGPMPPLPPDVMPSDLPSGERAQNGKASERPSPPPGKSGPKGKFDPKGKPAPKGPKAPPPR